MEVSDRAFGPFSFERVSRKIKTKTNIEKKNRQKQAVNLPYSGRTVKSLSFGTFVTNLELVIVTFCDDIPCHGH